MQRKYLGPILFGGTLLFTQDLAQQIMTLLQKQPYAEVAPLIAKMNEEATHQPAPHEAPPLPPPVAAPTPSAPFPPPAPSGAPAPHVPDLPQADIPPEPQ